MGVSGIRHPKGNASGRCPPKGNASGCCPLVKKKYRKPLHSACRDEPCRASAKASARFCSIRIRADSAGTALHPEEPEHRIKRKTHTLCGVPVQAHDVNCIQRSARMGMGMGGCVRERPGSEKANLQVDGGDRTRVKSRTENTRNTWTDIHTLSHTADAFDSAVLSG